MWSTAALWPRTMHEFQHVHIETIAHTERRLTASAEASLHARLPSMRVNAGVLVLIGGLLKLFEVLSRQQRLQQCSRTEIGDVCDFTRVVEAVGMNKLLFSRFQTGAVCHAGLSITCISTCS